VVAQQLPILAHSPYRGACHPDVLLIRRRAREAVVLSGQQPAGGDPAALGVLERLDDLEMKTADPLEEAGDPGL
jgi:hypothetical protein